VRSLAATLVVAAAFAGCGTTTTTSYVDASVMEEKIAADLERQTAESPAVTCPEEQEVVEGTTFRCTLKLDDGGTSAARVTLLDDDGGFRYELVRGR
jgi:hypothetical protein